MGGADKELEELKQEITLRGIEHLEIIFQEKLDNWKKVPLHVAIVGNVKTGKSSFINAIRGLKPEDVGAAKVGVNEQTSECTRYNYPNNPNLVYWDIPGCGTQNFPIQSYLHKINSEKYSFFMIVTGSAFTENDAKLADMLKKSNKPFFFIRTKIDIDVQNSKDDYPTSFNETNVVERIRNALQEANKKFGYERYPIFLISNRFPKRYDFGLLFKKMLGNVSDLKREVLVLSLPALSMEMLKEKREELERKMFWTMMKAGCISLIPVPVDIVAVPKLLVDEVSFYRQQFGLQDQQFDWILTSGAGVKLITKVTESQAKAAIGSIFTKTPVGFGLKVIYSIACTWIYLDYKLKVTYNEALANMKNMKNMKSKI